MFEESLGLFFYGIATFLSPCSVALISAYLVFAVGTSKSIRKGIAIGICFVAAMSFVFFILGYLLTALIPIEMLSTRFFYAISGLLLLIFGFNNLELLHKVNIFNKIDNYLAEKTNAIKYTTFSRISKYDYILGSFLFGVIISIALGPCSLALVLPAMMFTLFRASTPFHGGLLLLAFGMGHSIPVLFLSMLLATARQVTSQRLASVGFRFKKICGVAFLVLGIVMMIYALG
jgi:cytochrome c biogenesis protein CcdA